MPARPAAAPPGPAARQREVAAILLRLDEMLGKAGELAALARDRVGVGGLTRYRRFTRKVRDFFALAALADEKLDAVPPELAGPLATALDRMHTRMVVLFVEESAGFFASFARVEHLPVGTHEMCGLELRGLLAIRGFLDDPRYEAERGLALRAKADRVAELMRAVMARLPPLPDFGDLPSVGPRGTVNKPIKTARGAARGAVRGPPPPQAAAPPPPAAAPPAPPEVRQLSLDDFE
ncbi:hypothetical protein [Azospirillum sp. ST 5-10]|uniref:hypothetical protein n=1 Tax=unclassified Azospirillum TaxID=2630922 RepID=UPI003F49C964